MATMVEPLEDVKSFIAADRKMLIDGKWVAAASGKTFDTYNPATGELLARVAEGDKEDIDLAVMAARRAFDDGPWRTTTPADRAKLLWKLGDLIDARLEEFAQLETLDNGKPITISRLGDVPMAAAMFRYMAGWATKIEGTTIPLSINYLPGMQFHSYTLREPIGVVGQIIPWNFPLLMAAWKLAPALTCGCTIVLKPAEQTPLTALLLGEMICEAGFPDGVVNIVTGYGETAGAALSGHPNVDKVAFTGSTEVGKIIARAATGNLKRVTLELGGKSPNIVFADADPMMASYGSANAIFGNSGQVCCAGSRLYVEKSMFDTIVGGIAQAAEGIRLGPGMDTRTDMGPLVSLEQLDRVTGYIDAGRNEGAKIAVGGRKRESGGYFVEPTVLVDTKPNMKVVREEIFGPVVVAMPFTDIDDIAIEANDSEYGLAAGIWTKDISKAHRLAAKLQAGTVWINCWNMFDPALPFGGYKQSGWGREMGHEVLNNYLQTKAVTVML